MFRRFLERFGILSPRTHTRTEYLVTVFVTSEGTAQGIPRPLQVFKFEQIYNMDEKHTHALAPRYRVGNEVGLIFRNGFRRELADGTTVTYAPHTIYKITTKEVQND